jgi:hypothetical protein
MGSVIYMGRGSFRMEAIALDPEPDDVSRSGVVQPVQGSVTAPLHAAPRQAREGNEDGRPPRLRPLFGSQVDVPVLAAPTGSIGLRAPVVTLSRAMLGTLSGVVLLCGVVVGTAARHLLAPPAAPAMVTPTAAATPAVTTARSTTPLIAPLSRAPAADLAPPSPPPFVSLPAPVIRARAKAVVKAGAAPLARATPVKPQAKAWVDPWAE